MKYPIFNKKAYCALACMDFLLKPLHKAKQFPFHPKRILVCNLGHLGDVILTTTILEEINFFYPEAQIGFLTGSWSKAAIENHSAVNRVHIFDHWKLNRNDSTQLVKYKRHLHTKKIALEEIKNSGYELALDCRFHFPNAAPLLWQAKIPVRIGFESAGFGPLMTKTFPWNFREDRSAVDVFLSMLPQKRCKPASPQHSSEKQNYIVMHPGAGDDRKLWPLEKWIELTRLLTSDGYSLFFTGKGQKEFAAIEEISKYIPNIVNLCNHLDWTEFTACIRNASLLIGTDSSAGHVAAKVNTPSVLLFTGIHPLKIWKPYSPTVHALTKEVTCSPCFKGCHSMTCIRDISVETVYSMVKSINPLATEPVSSCSAK